MKYVLSCDGGGIRGAATAELLNQIQANLNIDIYKQFDLFAGTSTGAIIVIALAVKKMKAQKLVELYNYQNGNIIMNKSLWDRILGLVQNEPKYDGKGKTRILKKYFGDSLLNDAEKPTLVVTYDVEKRVSAVLKSTKPEKIPAVQAADASSAAPMYFPTAKVGKRYLIDGGVIANNPAMCAYAEAKMMWPDEEIKLLSLGTGKRTRKIDGKASMDFGFTEWIRHDLLGVVMDESVVEYQTKTILGNSYLRINSELVGVNDDMDDVTQQNIDSLIRLGKKWYVDNEQKLKEFFGQS
jgi:patatin-like phospholipase/acyl hydrolase